MDYYLAVQSEPEALGKSSTSVLDQLARLDLTAFREGTLAIVGMGASSHAGHVMVERLLRHDRRAVNLNGSDLERYLSTARVADSYLFVSEGGRSRETIAAADGVAAGARLGFTNRPDVPLSRSVDIPIALNHGDDSPVYTVGYVCTIQAFGLLAQAIDGVDEGDDWDALPALVREQLDTQVDAAARAAELFRSVTAVDFVGRGPSYATAAQGALMVREANRLLTGTYETLQYLHGPAEALVPGRGCVVIGDDREVRLAQYLAEQGVPVVLITSVEVPDSTNLVVIPVPTAPKLTRSILEILPIQLIVGDLARLSGIDIHSWQYHADDTKVTD
jgi:glucosamine--fructose-6-phosphate aminotransferase (isomerizing)